MEICSGVDENGEWNMTREVWSVKGVRGNGVGLFVVVVV